MPKNMKKNRIKKHSAKCRRASSRRINLCMIGFGLACVCCFSLIGLSNGHSGQNESRWIVENGEVEILAPAAEAPSSRLSESASQQPPKSRTSDQKPDDATAAPTITTPPTAAATPEPTSEPDFVPITITSVGDCTIGGDIPSGAYKAFDRYFEEKGAGYFFSDVRDLFESDDLTIINLEGPLTDSTDERHGRAFNFRGKPEYVDILSGSSIEVCNVANNHAMDYGEQGLVDTANHLETAGIGVSGFSRVYQKEINGVNVCSIGFTEWDYSEDQIIQMVSLAREQCDLLLVSIHWGEEGSHEPTALQTRLGRKIVDAGADIVLGTHSHVYGGVEQYNGKYIIYSLGNFCFGGNRNPHDKDCMIFQQTFNVYPDGSVTDGGINLIPARVSSSDNTNDFRPYIINDTRGITLLHKIARVSNVDVSQTIWMETSYPVAKGMVA
ncbi:MAG: CapA family protein [Christensenellales bacterium]|nr:CapA family protein [Christensenellales bacterium]